jgi:hypothetical protein
LSTGEVVKPRSSSTTSKVAATGAGISIAAIIGLWSQVAPVIEQVKPIIHQFSPDSIKKIDAIQDDIKKIDPLIKVITDKIKVIEDNQQRQVTPKPEPTPVDPVPNPTPTPDQQRIADMEAQIRKLLDEIAKKHEPPAPVPVLDGLKIVDAAGKPITGDIPSGQSVKVQAGSPGDFAWVVNRGDSSTVSVFKYPDHCIVTLTLKDGQTSPEVTFSHKTDNTHAMIIVRCQDAPRPPPVPIPVEPVEPDKKQVSTHKVGGIYICVSPGQTSVDESIVIKDLPYWDGLRATGITVSMHTPSAVDEIGKWALEQMRAKGIPPPAIVLVDKDRFLLDVVPVPKSTAAVDAVIAKAGGR